MTRLDNLTKQNGRRLVLLEASAALQNGAKVGLVGPNGAGKTTLFRMLTGEGQPDEEKVASERGITTGDFSQDVGEIAGRSVVAETMAGAGPVNLFEARKGEEVEALRRHVDTLPHAARRPPFASPPPLTAQTPEEPPLPPATASAPRE